MIFKKLFSIFIIFLIFCFVGLVLFQNKTVIDPQSSPVADMPGKNTTSLPLNIPQNYLFSIFASNLGNPRDLIFDNNNNILVSDTSGGRILAIPINDPDNSRVILSGLNKPHGLAINCEPSNCKLFVAQTNQVDSYDYQNFSVSNKTKILNLPNAGFHFTRSLLIKENKLYIATGSDCNVCRESDPIRASIYSANLDGSDFTSFATGLRNSVFMSTNPETGEIWATEMGRDYLGDDLPPDEINIIHLGNYGWPYCYGNNVHDPTTSRFRGASNNCEGFIPAHIEIPAHSAPLGLSFISANELLVAYHGSWNRSTPTGYKIVKITLDNQGKLISVTDFISGWLQNGQVLGRPVAILTSIKNNTSYITDDKSGVIYKLEKLN